MTFDPDTEDYRFQCSGRTFNANCGIIGIDPDGDISEGYDGGIDVRADPEKWTGSDLSQEERIELADYMIRRWEAFKN
jgi:hypothetical protein